MIIKKQLLKILKIKTLVCNFKLSRKVKIGIRCSVVVPVTSKIIRMLTLKVFEPVFPVNTDVEKIKQYSFQYFEP